MLRAADASDLEPLGSRDGPSSVDGLEAGQDIPARLQVPPTSI
jgi:hypothetical protein